MGLDIPSDDECINIICEKYNYQYTKTELYKAFERHPELKDYFIDMYAVKSYDEKLDTTITEPIMFMHIGLFYMRVKNNSTKALKYYEKSVNTKPFNPICLYHVGTYFMIHADEIDREKALPYLGKALELGQMDASYYLGLYQQKYSKNFDKMKFYYNLAITKGIYTKQNALFNMSAYYFNIEKDYLKARYYLIKVIKMGDYDEVRLLRRTCSNDVEYFSILHRLYTQYKNPILLEYLQKLEIKPKIFLTELKLKVEYDIIKQMYTIFHKDFFH